MSARLIVTLDGPAGSGKSSVARRLAQALEVAFLDTGAMYRMVGLACERAGVDAGDRATVEEMAEKTRLGFDWQSDPPAPLLNGELVGDAIRRPEISSWASKVAAYTAVRHVLVAEQQRLGEEHPRLVTEGRDQGSVVFPDATFKFYLTAKPEERARRRVAQLAASGVTVDFQQTLDEIIERDTRDQSREEGPLVCPEDALEVDTTELSEDEVLATLVRCVRGGEA